MFIPLEDYKNKIITPFDHGCGVKVIACDLGPYKVKVKART